MNKQGIMVDISHVTDSTFWQVIRITKAPVIASHSSCRAFTPGWERNMSDEAITALKTNGGIIMINFGSDFLDGSIQKKNDLARNELMDLLKSQGLTAQDSLAKPIIQAFEKSHHALYSDVKKVVDHIEHVIKLAGIDHIGLGSDFDGVGDSLPIGLKDVSAYPNILFEYLTYISCLLEVLNPSSIVVYRNISTAKRSVISKISTHQIPNSGICSCYLLVIPIFNF